VGPASMIVGNLVAGKRIAQASGRDVGQLEDNDQARKVDCHPHFTHDALQNIPCRHGYGSIPEEVKSEIYSTKLIERT